jgi:SAM-dependent methyltransferase
VPQATATDVSDWLDGGSYAAGTVTRVPNAEQIEYWDGAAGDHWVAQADRYDWMNVHFGERIVDALQPRPGEQVLDIGCGNGAVSLAIARLVTPNGIVRGLDISGPMLATAHRRAEQAGLDNVTFDKGDAQVYPLPDATFDAAVVRFGVMFFDDPAARLVLTCWQELSRNEWLMVPAGAALAHVPMPDLGAPGQPGPFSLADPDRIRALLASFVDVAIDDVTAPMRLGDSVDDVVAFMQTTDIAHTLMKDVDEDTNRAAWEAVHAALRPYDGPDGVTLSGAAWLVDARRSN